MVDTVVTGIHVDDVGTAFIIEFLQDASILNISTSTIRDIRFQKPDGTSVIKTGDFVTDGSDGQAQYIAELDFLDTIGTWKIQGKVTMPSGVWYSAHGYFEVESNI